MNTPLERKPFVNYTLDSEKKEQSHEVISLKLNLVERQAIERLKRIMNYKQDGKVIKAALIVLENVILNTFGEPLFKKLTDENRRRAVFEELPKDKPVEQI